MYDILYPKVPCDLKVVSCPSIVIFSCTCDQVKVLGLSRSDPFQCHSENVADLCCVNVVVNPIYPDQGHIVPPPDTYLRITGQIHVPAH